MKRLILVLLAAIVVAIASLWIVGLLLPTSHLATQSRWFGAPRDSLWRVVTDVRGYPSWRKDVDSVIVLDDPVTWREYGSFGAITFSADEMTPGERFIVRIAEQDLGFGGRWIYVFADSAGGTTLTIAEEGQITNAFFRAISRYVTGYDATLRQYLDDLARRVP